MNETNNANYIALSFKREKMQRIKALPQDPDSANEQDSGAWKMARKKQTKKEVHWLDMRYNFAWGFHKEQHPQESLRRFYQGASIYFYLETVSFFLWIGTLLALKFGVEIFVGTPYREACRSQFAHFFTVAGMVGVVQQAKNNNSIQWWLIIYFLLGLFADLEMFLELVFFRIDKTSINAWSVLVFQASWMSALSLFAVIWFVVWFFIIRPKDIPIPASLVQQWEKEKKEQKKLLN